MKSKFGDSFVGEGEEFNLEIEFKDNLTNIDFLFGGLVNGEGTASIVLRSSLVALSEDFFNNMDTLTSAACAISFSRLYDIPKKIFSDCHNITDFTLTFYYTYKDDEELHLYEMPIDNDGNPLYMRAKPGKEGYVIPTQTQGCFTSDVMVDGQNIPEDWAIKIGG